MDSASKGWVGSRYCFEGFVRPNFVRGDLVGCRQALLRGQGLGRLRVGSASKGLVSRTLALFWAWSTAGSLCFEGFILLQIHGAWLAAGVLRLTGAFCRINEVDKAPSFDVETGILLERVCGCFHSRGIVVLMWHVGRP